MAKRVRTTKEVKVEQVKSKHKLSKHHIRRRNKRLLVTAETMLLVLLIGAVCFLSGKASSKFDSIEEKISIGQSQSDEIARKLDSLDAHVSALHEITETNRSRSKQIAVGARIISNARKDFSMRQAANMSRLIFDESEFNNTVEFAFLLALIESESRFSPLAVSPAGAIGLGQLMPATAEKMARHSGMQYDTKLLTDPKYNLKLSVQYLSRLGKQFQNNVLVAAAYNGGPGGAQKYQRWIEGELPKDSVHKETVAYVETVMQRYYTYRGMLQ